MDELPNIAAEMGFRLSADQLESFSTYLRELQEWNARTNLTAVDDERGIALKHFADSLSLLPELPEGAFRLIDIGAGAGFPGLPLKIVRPEIDVTLLDATAKKTEFLTHMIATLKLAGAAAIHGRAEEIARDEAYRETFDVAVARAVAKLPALAELALPFVKVGGRFIAQKQAHDGGENEIEGARNALSELGGEILAVKNAPAPLPAGRQLVIISKISATPEKYPRRPGLPGKRPL
jgi:16S rRNA (guanine527-N7)-methyltransferase